MKFGVQLPTFGQTASPDLVLRSARLAEDLGFDSVWTNDHVLIPASLATPYYTIFECIVTLSGVATVTRRVKLGTSILVLPQRNPVILAKQLATLDVMSDGRLICGVGAGYVEEEMKFLGADFRRRGTLTEDYLKVMRHLWADGGGTFEVGSISFQDALFAPVPARGGRLPIWLAGNSDAAIKRAAKLADYWHPGAITVEELSAGALRLRELAGQREVGVSVKLRVQFPWTRGSDVQRSPEMYSSQHDLCGDVEEICDELARYEEAGLEYLVAFFYHGDWAELERAITTFAERVMPQFKEPDHGDS